MIRTHDYFDSVLVIICALFSKFVSPDAVFQLGFSPAFFSFIRAVSLFLYFLASVGSACLIGVKYNNSVQIGVNGLYN